MERKDFIMTTRKLGRTALIAVLALSIIMSITGGTIAWFTDEVTSAGNKIEAGNLDIELYKMDKQGNWNNISDSKDALFTGNLWEPGYTTYQVLKVVNEGTLALKWKTSIVCNGEISKLAEAIDVYVSTAEPSELPVDRNAVAGMTLQSDLATFIKEAETRTAGNLDVGETAYLTLGLKMRESAGNEYQGLTLGNFDVKILATQDTVESDSFGADYDRDATFYPPVSSAEELAAALQNNQSVALANDVTVASTMTVPAAADLVIDLNGHDLSYTVSNSGASAIINNKGNLEITGEGTISFVADNPDEGTIPAYATNTITNTGTLTIGEGVTVTNGSEGGASYAVDNHGVFYLNGGTLIGDRCALRVAKYNQDNVVFVMNGGLVEAKTPAWIQLPGSDASIAPKISVTINGGTMQSTKASSADNNVMYTYSYGNSHANTSVTINGGEFLGGTVSIGSGYKGDAPKMTINGGTFEYDVLQWLENDEYKVLLEGKK